MLEALQTAGNPGRGAHEPTLHAARLVYGTREALAELFHAESPACIAFASNATQALNTAINGLIGPGDHVITTVCEHNSVLRPLYRLRQQGAELSFLGVDARGVLQYDQLETLLRPNTKAIVVTHASNVTGNGTDLARVSTFAKRHGLLFIVDAAQTAGVHSIDVQALGIDVLCFTGHKGLLGPQGTGGFYVRPGLRIAPLVVGGSGYAGHRQKEYGLCGALLSLAVFSFSSYPFQFLLFVVALALLVTGCAIKTLSSRRPLVCMAGTVFLLLSAGYGCYRVYRWKEVRETASSAWHRKQMFYRSGAYEQAAEVYAEIYEDMKWNARYLFEYGHALHKLHRNEESNVVMKEALKVSGDPMILNIIGKNEQEAGNYAEAEYWLIRSTHRLPGRIYPYFLLAKLYAEPGFYQR